MNCAAELIVMKEIAENEYRAEEKRRDMEAVQNHRKVVEDTIQFCETEINDCFVNLAKQRENLAVKMKLCPVLNHLNYEHVQVLKKDHPVKDRENHVPAGNVYDLPTLKEYLEKHCFVVEAADGIFYRYGLGTLKYDCVDLLIYVPKNPCNT